MKFKQLTGECDTKEWVSPKLNNGEFDYWIVLQIADMHAMDRDHVEHVPRFHARLCVVAPSLCPARELEHARGMRCYIAPSEFELADVESLFLYGTYAQVWQTTHNNPLTLMLEGVKQAEVIEGFLGMFLDQPVNRMGTTGWESLRCDNDSALKRLSPDHLIAKMHRAAKAA